MQDCLVCGEEDKKVYKCSHCTIEACRSCWTKWKLSGKDCFQCKRPINVVGNCTVEVLEKIKFSENKCYYKIIKQSINSIDSYDPMENIKVKYMCPHCNTNINLAKKYKIEKHLLNHLKNKHLNLD